MQNIQNIISAVASFANPKDLSGKKRLRESQSMEETTESDKGSIKKRREKKA